jgi:hypothetical protein
MNKLGSLGGSLEGLGYLTTVAKTKNPFLFGQTITLSSGTQIVIDQSGNMQWDRPFYCLGNAVAPSQSAWDLLMQDPLCQLSVWDYNEIGSYTDIGASMSAASVAAEKQQIPQTYEQQCQANPELCAIARSQMPIVPAVESTVADIAAPVVCPPLFAPQLQTDGSYKCVFKPSNPTTWLLIGVIGFILLVK